MDYGFYYTQAELNLAVSIYHQELPLAIRGDLPDVKDVLKEVYSTDEKLVVAVKSKADPAAPLHILKLMKLSNDLDDRSLKRQILQDELKFHMYVNKDNNKHIAIAKPMFFQFQNHFGMEVELFPMGDLTQALPKALPTLDKMKIMHGAARGVAYLHSIGIVHADIKMRNIVVVKGDNGALTAKLIDFGSAKVSGKMLEPGSKWGDTKRWRGPDLWSLKSTALDAPPNAIPIRGSADVWSLGCVIMCLVVNQRRPPWKTAKGEDPDYTHFVTTNPLIEDKNHSGLNPPPIVLQKPEFAGFTVGFVNELIFNMLRIDPALRISAESVATRLQLWTQATMETVC